MSDDVDTLLSTLVSGGAQDPDKTKAIVNALRTRQAYGELFSATGDKALGPMGGQILSGVNRDVQQAGTEATAAASEATRSGQFDRLMAHNQATEAENSRWHDMVDARDRDLAAERDQAKKDRQAQFALDPDTLKDAAQRVAADPNMMRQYASGYGEGPQLIRKQINDQITQNLHAAGMNGSDLTGLQAKARAEGKSIQQMVPQLNAITAFEKLGKFNGDRLLQLINGVDTTGVPALEGAIRAAKAKGGNVNVNEFNSVMNAFQTEAARILNNPNLSGVLTDTAKDDLKNVINGSLDAPSTRRVINRLYQEFDVRKGTIQNQIDEAQGSMRSLGGVNGPPQALPGALGVGGAPGTAPQASAVPGGPQALPNANLQPTPQPPAGPPTPTGRTGIDRKTGKKFREMSDGSVEPIP